MIHNAAKLLICERNRPTFKVNDKYPIGHYVESVFENFKQLYRLF